MAKYKELKKTVRYKCIKGTCEECTEIKNGQGIHIVEVYNIYDCDEIDCLSCNGEGSTERTCPYCDGWGHITEPCQDCKGTGKEADIEPFSEKKLIKEEYILQKPKGGDSRHSSPT